MIDRPRHRRTSAVHRRRRVVAGLLAVLVVGAVALAVTTISSGSSETPSAADSGTAAKATTTEATTTTTTTPVAWRTNPNPPTPRPDDGTRPTVVYFGDSMSVNAGPQLKDQLSAAGYDVVQFTAAIGSSMCRDEADINTALDTLQPNILVLQYEGNGSLWNCLDGYQPSYDLYHRSVTAIGQNAAAHGTHVVLVAPIPFTDGTPLYPGSSGTGDAFRDLAAADPATFTYLDATTGLVNGPGALADCYPDEPGCRPDGKIQVRPDDTNKVTGVFTAGGGSHFCTNSVVVSLSEEDCNVPNAGGLRFSYNVVNGLRAAGL